jgi:hypothetical protein
MGWERGRKQKGKKKKNLTGPKGVNLTSGEPFDYIAATRKTYWTEEYSAQWICSFRTRISLVMIGVTLIYKSERGI